MNWPQLLATRRFPDQPLPPDRQAAFARMAQASVDAQKAIEAADSLPFEQYLEQYVSPARLVPRAMQARAAQPA